MTIKEAINVLQIQDWEIIYLTDNDTEPNIYKQCPSYSVKEIRNTFDMSKIEVVKIYTNHYMYSADINWRFCVKTKICKANEPLIEEFKKRYIWAAEEKKTDRRIYK